MKTADCAMKSAKFIRKEIDAKILILPGEIGMSCIADEVGTTPQLVGMAFEQIAKILNSSGIKARAAGTPRVILLEYLSKSTD